MLLAYDYPLLSIVVSISWFFLWILWLCTLFGVIGDIFRSHDLRGGSKVGWLGLVLVLPFLGVFVYVMSRGDKMGQHAIDAQKAQDLRAASYIRETVGSVDVGRAGGRSSGSDDFRRPHRSVEGAPRVQEEP